MNKDLKFYWDPSYDLGELVYVRRIVPAPGPLRNMVIEIIPGIIIEFMVSQNLSQTLIKVLCGDEEVVVGLSNVLPFEQIYKKEKQHD